MEMKMVAVEDTPMGEDLTPPIPPLSYALHRSFLDSHCSLCFSTVSAHSHHHHYLSTADLHLLNSLPPTHNNTSDLRVALHLLPRAPPGPRIFGLLTNRHKLMSSDISDELRSGAMAVVAARRLRLGSSGDGEVVGGDGEGLESAEAALCAVVTNAVEVVDGEGRALGIAVYGTDFSWINHSCSPNACYHFEIVSDYHDVARRHQKVSKLRIMPFGDQTHINSDTSCSNGVWRDRENYGPRIVVRSIKPIKKGEEVTVAYTDLLQPKEVRQSELHSKYQFTCHCRRCSQDPPAYVDHVLQDLYAPYGDFFLKNVDSSNYEDKALRDLSDMVNNTITDYMLEYDPGLCCEKLEKLLLKGVLDEESGSKAGQSTHMFSLHPLHHLSLNMYTVLASAYKVRSFQVLDQNPQTDGDMSQAFLMIRISVAYSVLLAGAVHHLFQHDSSLIASVATYWTGAGESLLALCRRSTWSEFWNLNSPVSTDMSVSRGNLCGCSVFDEIGAYSSSLAVSKADFESTSGTFLSCVTDLTGKIWGFLAHGSQYLQTILDPIHFVWLGTMKKPSGCDSFMNSHCETGGSIFAHDLYGSFNGEKFYIHQLGLHCLLYGRYLLSIGHGQHLRFINDLSS